MSRSIVKLLAYEKLIGNNYTTRKSNLNTILVNHDLKFVLTNECPLNPGSNANWTVWDEYDKKGKGKDKIPTDGKRKVQNAYNEKCFHCNEKRAREKSLPKIPCREESQKNTTR